MNKDSQIQNIFKQAAALKAATQKKQEDLIPVKEIEEEVESSASLPTDYVTANGIMVTSKEVMTNTNFLSKLDLSDTHYKDLTFTPEEAKRIQNEMVRMTTGVISVTPLTCLGNSCSFASTCVDGDTLVTTYNSINGVKKIKDLQVGDIVYSVNIDAVRVEHDTVLAVSNMGVKSVYTIKTHTGLSLICTDDHPILTLQNDQILYQSIKDGLGDGSRIFIADTDGVADSTVDSLGDLLIDTIEDVILNESSVEVWDITVKNNSNFIANNIVVHNCPLVAENKAPIGKDCLIEVNLIKYWMSKYVQEFNVDPNSLTDLHMVAKLCEYDILEMRASKYLKSTDTTLLTDFITSYDEHGSPISNKIISPAFDLKERIDKMRSKTLKELVATREAKLKIIDTQNKVKSSNTLADLKEQLDSLIKNRPATKDIIDIG